MSVDILSETGKDAEGRANPAWECVAECARLAERTASDEDRLQLEEMATAISDPQLRAQLSEWVHTHLKAG